MYFCSFLLRIRPPPISTLFPYTTLFRSQMAAAYAAIANRGVWSRPHLVDHVGGGGRPSLYRRDRPGDRKSTRLNSSHGSISYAVFGLKKKHVLRKIIAQ